jgi:hypothetical protein
VERWQVEAFLDSSSEGVEQLQARFRNPCGVPSTLLAMDNDIKRCSVRYLGVSPNP